MIVGWNHKYKYIPLTLDYELVKMRAVFLMADEKKMLHFLAPDSL